MKKKLKDTKIGALLKEKAPKVLDAIGDILPSSGTLGIIKNVISQEPDLTPEEKEARIIRPAIERAIHDGVNVGGPFAADSMFKFVRADCYLAMYHDQGLPVIKYADFDNTVNATLGLPFLRTSPDHGTAADLAGKGVVLPHSMRAAVQLAAAASTAS